jgi:hypothetical protein
MIKKRNQISKALTVTSDNTNIDPVGWSTTKVLDKVGTSPNAAVVIAVFLIKTRRVVIF